MTQYSAQFGADAVGSPPAGWTARWATTSSTWAVQTALEIEAGKNLRHTATATGKRLLSLDALDADIASDNIELLTRFKRSSTSGNQGIFALRASGAAGAERGYRVIVTSSAIQLRKYLAGVDSSVSSVSFTAAADVKYYIRVRANGTTLQVRIWPASTTEPVTWNISITDANIAGAGWAGFAADTNTGNRDWDFLGVGTNGDVAAYPTDGTERPRATQVATLTLDASEADAHITQTAVMILEGGAVLIGDARATQAAILLLTAEEVGARVTQAAVLALVHETPCLQKLAQCWTIARLDGTIYRFTTHDEPVILQAQTFLPCESLQSTAASGGLIATGAGDIQIRGIISDDSITERDLLGGMFDGATVEVWEQQWVNNEQGMIPRRLAKGILGKISQSDISFKADMLSPGARLHQRPLLRPHTPACRFDLGDGRCPVDIEALRVSGTVTGLPDRNVLQRSEYRMFQDTARVEADGYFNDGSIIWTSGLNTGLTAEVRTNQIGWLTLWAPSLYRIAIGDGYTMIPGCSKTTDDHTVKFGLDMVDFGGFPDLPGNDTILKTPNAKA